MYYTIIKNRDGKEIEDNESIFDSYAYIFDYWMEKNRIWDKTCQAVYPI